MTTLAKDARFFVEGVTKYLRGSGSGGETILPKVTAVLQKITAADRSHKTATVESAVLLTPREKGDIVRFLSRLLTHTVRIECRTNKSLIGGLRIVVGDWVVDTSLSSQIHAMAGMLT